MPLTSPVRRRRWAALLGYAVVTALALTGLAAAPASATDPTVVVSGHVAGDLSEDDETGISTMLWACQALPTDVGFDPDDCTQSAEPWEWQSDYDGTFELDDFPAGRYLVAGDVSDPYADYVPAAVSSTPMTVSGTDLSVTLSSRPEVAGVTASLSPRQPIAGQSVTMTLVGADGTDDVGYYWPGDESSEDYRDQATYPVPLGQAGQSFYAYAMVERAGHRRTLVWAPAPYPVWASADQGGVLQGTITDVDGVIESAEDIWLSICDETGTGIGVAGSDAYQVIDNGDGTFSYEVIVPNGTYCLDAIIDYAGGQDHLLASSVNSHWDPADDDYSGAEMFEVDGGDDAKKAITIDLDFVADGGSTGGDDEIVLHTAPAFSTSTPTVGQAVSVTALPTFQGAPLDGVDYLWTVKVGSDLWSPQQFDAGPYTPAGELAGKQLYLRVMGDRGDASFDQTFLVGTIVAPKPPAKPAQAMPKGAVTKVPTSVGGVKKGKVKAGTKLKVKPPKIKLAGAKVSCQWTLNGKPVAGATKKKFKTTKKQKGKKVGVIITVSKPGYLPLVKTLKAGKVKK